MRCLLLVVAILATACGGDNDRPLAPSPPPPVQIAGNWSGTFESNYSPEAVLVNLTQVGANVTGTWAMTSGVRATGNVSGAVDAGAFTGIITYGLSSGAICQGSFSGLSLVSSLNWSSPGFTGNCGLSAPGNPVNVRFVLQRR